MISKRGAHQKLEFTSKTGDGFAPNN